MQALVPLVLIHLFGTAIAQAPEPFIFEDFETVAKWQGFELSTTQAKSGNSSACWAGMDRTPRVECSDIPHDWTGYSHFTFWVYSEKPVQGRFVCLMNSENPQTEGPDYYLITVDLSRPGWRRYGIAIGRTEGARTPRGWDQIDSITFTAAGWGNEPNPEAVVFIDKLELTNEMAGPGPLLKDPEFFAMLREDIPGLAATREAVAAGDYHQAKVEFLQYMRSREKPVWRFDWRDWNKSRQESFDRTRADRVVAHIFSAFGREVNLGPDIDWTTNGFDPTEPDYTPEWTYSLNRFGSWVELGRAYWATGDEKYAQEFVAQMLDWTADQLAPVLGNPNSGPCWRTIEQGIRTAGSWMDAYHYFLGSPSMTPEAHCTFVKSFVEHAQTLHRMTVEYPEHGGNWVTMECNGLAHIGVMFPEFKEAQDWREVAYSRLSMELDRQVYPDGAQMELTGGYHQVARSNFKAALDPLLRNGLPLPEGYLEKLERMYRYNLECMMPTGQLPPLNDSGLTGVQDSLREAYELYGNEEYLWGATGGAEGKAVDFTSIAFPWAGQYVMRSGWQKDDLYLMFEAGPFGTGHQHEDKLGIFLYGFGRILLNEAGTYTYDRSKWRRYALSTESHNTIMVDGQPQHRSGLIETYQAQAPLEGNWVTTAQFDWATGVYNEGYGRDRDKSVTHERTIIFVRPDYFVVLDRLLGEGEHTYSNIFHLDVESAAIDEQTLIVQTTEPDSANLALVPLDREGLTVSILKGQEDPVQGWIPRERHRPVATPIYQKTGSCPQLFITLLVPYPAGEQPNIAAELLDVDVPRHEALGIRVSYREGTDTLLYSFEGSRALQGDGVVAEARLALVRRAPGKEPAAAAMDGRIVAF
ncbi:MAG: heparinase II/III family protein [Candidatus Zipacnadales bacterium]